MNTTLQENTIISEKFIVYIVPGIYPFYTGGMEIFYSKLIPEVAKYENVILITRCKEIVSNDFIIHSMPQKLADFPGSKKIGIYIYVAIKLIQLRKKIRLVHLPYTSNSGIYGFIFPLLKKIFKINYLIHIHSGEMREWKKYKGDKLLLQSAQKIVAVSSVIKKEYEERIKRTIEVVLPLVPFESSEANKEEIKLEFELDKRSKIILFVGSLKKLKAPEILLEAFMQIDEEIIKSQNLKLVFVGDGKLREHLQARISVHQYRKYVTICGKVPYSEIPKYYRIADIYVITSKYEGTSKSLLEAMYNKTPIIGSNVNGIGNILSHKENALLFEKGNATQLKENIIYLINNTRISKKYAEAAYNQYLRTYSFENTVLQLTEIYKK